MVDITNNLLLSMMETYANNLEAIVDDRTKQVIGNSKISAQELKEVGRDELTGVNLGQVDPATLQATKIACAHPPSLFHF